MSQLVSRTFHVRVYLIILCWVIFVSQVIESVESIVELLLLCCLSLAVALPNSRQHIYLWRLFHCIMCERVPGSPLPYCSSSSCGGRAWPDTASCYMVLLFVFMPRIHFEKAEVAYQHHRLGHHTTVLHGVAAHCSRIFHFVLLSATLGYVSRWIIWRM